MNTRKTLIVATRNKGKIKEIKALLSDINFEIKSLTEVGLDIDVQETGKTFSENAILKAKIIGEKTGQFTLADDSGLEIDALEGAPGVLSARYADGTNEGRINKILQKLAGIPQEKRTARFKCVIALFIPTAMSSSRKRGSGKILDQVGNDTIEKIVTFEGVSEGYITEKTIGQNGFDYDPIFYNPELGKTNGEATTEEKNSVSHRARALEKCKKLLISLQ